MDRELGFAAVEAGVVQGCGYRTVRYPYGVNSYNGEGFFQYLGEWYWAKGHRSRGNPEFVSQYGYVEVVRAEDGPSGVYSLTVEGAPLECNRRTYANFTAAAAAIPTVPCRWVLRLNGEVVMTSDQLADQRARLADRERIVAGL
jgi:hypothetical protein